MNNLEKEYYDIRLSSFNYALNILHNFDDAEDIAQNVCLKYLQKKETINNPKNWCITVAKNEAYALSKKRNNTHTNEKLEILQTQQTKHTEIIPEFATISKAEAKELLNKKDYDFYKLMLKYDQNSYKMAKAAKRSKSYIYGACYRVKRNLKAAKLLKEDYIASRDIVDYNMNKKIIYFINLFSKKISMNDTESLYKYLENYTKSLPTLEIVKTYDYEIRLLGETKYRLSVPYKNSSNLLSMYFVYFIINNKNNIKVYDFIEKPMLIQKLKISKKEALDKLRPMRKGLLQETRKEIEEIFKDDIDNSYKGNDIT